MSIARFATAVAIATSALLAACAANPEPVEAAPQSAPQSAPMGLPPPPATRVEAVTDTYHGVSVTEGYRWLEDWSNPDVQAWTQTQNDYARDHLDHLPGVDTVRAEVEAVLKGDTKAYHSLAVAGGLTFAEMYAPPKQQDLLVVTELTDTGALKDGAAVRVLLDPNLLDPSGATTIDWFAPSHDGKLVAVSLSKAGTESGDLHVYDVASGEQVHEVIPRVNSGTAGGHLAWAPDDKGFYYTRHPRGDERPPEDAGFYQQLYFHALGTPTEKDRYELGEGLPRIAEIEVVVDVPSARTLATVQNGDGGEFAHYLRDPKGKWRQLSAFSDRVVQMVFGRNDDLYLISRRDAPHGKLLRIAVKDIGKDGSVAKAKELLPEGEDTLVNSFWGAPSIVVTATRLYVTYQLGGPSVIRAFTHEGKPATAPEQLPVSAVSDLVTVPAFGDDILFNNESFVEPSAYYRFDAESGATTRTALVTTSPAAFEGVEVVREMAASKDGTKVPVNIIKPAGIALDGTHALILYGYGGYGVNITPHFNPVITVLLQHRVLFAVANIRGGGEYGEEWHLQGNLTRKQNVFDDFYAAARHVIDRGFTSSKRLGLRGGSNGGLLMGATVVQHPDLARVVVSHVGIYDMLRVELSPNGAFNVTEFGTVANAEQFAALHAYSPYHHVQDGTSYPAMLMPTGVNDPRVDPMHSRKMVARLQAANTATTPILLRTSLDTGHGSGTPLDELIDKVVDETAFYFHYLGVELPAAPEVQKHADAR